MRQNYIIALAAFFGAIVGIVGMHFFGNDLPLSRVDIFTFVITALLIVIGVFTIFGAIAVVNTWNDIDKKGREITDRHIETFKRERQEKRVNDLRLVGIIAFILFIQLWLLNREFSRNSSPNKSDSKKK